jgi:ATP-dependent Clp protease ATP-binding subunit ClpX
LQEVTTQDLLDFGFEHEFIGRLPVWVACEPLSEEDLFAVLTQSEHSVIKQYPLGYRHHLLDGHPVRS